jgi:transaldolase
MRLLNVGARAQRMLWASTGTKDPKASDILYVKSLAAPYSVNTMPENTLQVLTDHGDISTTIPPDGGDAEQVLERFTQAGIDRYALAADLQREGAASFVKSWDDLLVCIAEKSTQLKS